MHNYRGYASVGEPGQPVEHGDHRAGIVGVSGSAHQVVEHNNVDTLAQQGFRQRFPFAGARGLIEVEERYFYRFPFGQVVADALAVLILGAWVGPQDRRLPQLRGVGGLHTQEVPALDQQRQRHRGDQVTLADVGPAV
jgi:hypothetical protein